MTDDISLKQARELWRQYQQELKDAAYWESEGYEVDGYRLGGFLVADDIMERAGRIKARFDRIMSARSYKRSRSKGRLTAKDWESAIMQEFLKPEFRKPAAEAVKVAEDAR